MVGPERVTCALPTSLELLLELWMSLSFVLTPLKCCIWRGIMWRIPVPPSKVKKKIISAIDNILQIRFFSFGRQSQCTVEKMKIHAWENNKNTYFKKYHSSYRKRNDEALFQDLENL